MESTVCFHGQYPVSVLFCFAVPAALVAGGAVWWAAQPQRSVAGRVLALVAAVGAHLALLVLAGQHVPVLERIAPEAYCFGQPGAVHYLGLVLPVVAALSAVVLGRGRRAVR
jgi:hypothetical protein